MKFRYGRVWKAVLGSVWITDGQGEGLVGAARCFLNQTLNLEVGFFFFESGMEIKISGYELIV